MIYEYFDYNPKIVRFVDRNFYAYQMMVTFYENNSGTPRILGPCPRECRECVQLQCSFSVLVSLCCCVDCDHSTLLCPSQVNFEQQSSGPPRGSTGQTCGNHPQGPLKIPISESVSVSRNQYTTSVFGYLAKKSFYGSVSGSRK